MINQRITKEELESSLAKLLSGEGIEAKFYNKGGTIVVTFEKRDEPDGPPAIKYRIGRSSKERFNYTDIDSAWGFLTVEKHLLPPKELLSVLLPKKVSKRYIVPHIQDKTDTKKLECEEKYYCNSRSLFNAREIAYQEAELRIADYNERKECFCHGIGLRKVKLFLNACIKEGDENAQLYRYALEAEGENLKAKKALHKYHSDYYAYEKRNITSVTLLICVYDCLFHLAYRHLTPPLHDMSCTTSCPIVNKSVFTRMSTLLTVGPNIKASGMVKNAQQWKSWRLPSGKDTVQG